ncbi:Serine proteinase stubblelike, partial [Caligus rogercresseyi]
SEILLRTSLTVLESTHAYCFDGHNRSLPDSKLCAYGLNHDACFGDSGGPLIVEENGRCTVVGVVSYGFGCSTQFVAGVYTRVTEFMDWIKGHAAVGGCMEPKSSLKCDLLVQ